MLGVCGEELRLTPAPAGYVRAALGCCWAALHGGRCTGFEGRCLEMAEQYSPGTRLPTCTQQRQCYA